jgi:hypothetical protein
MLGIDSPVIINELSAPEVSRFLIPHPMKIHDDFAAKMNPTPIPPTPLVAIAPGPQSLNQQSTKYAFRTVLAHETVYELMLIRQRREFHQVGCAV